MGRCPKCGATLVAGAVFCNSCGSRIEAGNGFYQPAGQPNYGQPGYDRPNMAYRPVQTNRSLIMYIILSIVTCGLYGFFFVYKLAEDVNQMCLGDGETTAGLGMYILLSILTCGLYSIYWLYKIQNRLYAAGPRHGIPVSETGTTFLLWYIVGSFVCGIGALVAMNIVISSANKVGTAYNMKYVYGR